MTRALHALSISEMADLLRKRQLSPVELVQAHLDRIADLNPKIDAFITVTETQAKAAAKQAEAEILRGDWRGPLHGVPFALKDIIATAGIRTTANSRLLAGNVPSADAATAAHLYQAGGILLGKLATFEFAHGGPSFDLPWPAPRNPWNTERMTGGSSSGSAAAVAAGLTPLALGTDTGGSIRVPSWFCGTVGLKPTFGRVSRTGVIPFSENCDQVGPITWTVEDAAIALQAIEGVDALDPTTRPGPALDLAAIKRGIKGKKFGFVRHFSEIDAVMDAELRAAVDRALDVLRDLGAEVEDVVLRPLQNYYDVRIVISEADCFSLHLKQFQRDPNIYGRRFLARCLPACLFTAADYVNAQRERGKMMAELSQAFRMYDALITVGAGPAPRLVDFTSAAKAPELSSIHASLLGSLANVAGLPALAMCCGFSRDGLPLGLQILGRPWEDDAVLAIGHAYEAATSWRDVRPEMTMPPPDRIEEASDLIVVDCDETMRAAVAAAARRAGLNLDDELFEILLAGAPQALEMARRISRNFDYADELPTIFQPRLSWSERNV